MFEKFNFVLILLGLVFCLEFSIPFILKRIINIGNVTGCAMGMVFIVLGLMWYSVKGCIKTMYNQALGKTVITIVAWMMAAIILLVIVETAFMVKAAANRGNSSTIVVLGCKVIGDRPTRVLQERIDAAYEYLKENPEAKCVASGGKGYDETMAEGECIYRELVKRGIDSDRIYIEDQSTSTRENLLFSKKIIEENGLNQSIAICTNEFHEYRAGMVADSLGLKYYAVPARTTMWLLPTYYIRELYGILYEWIL